jgi:hypothetical protein
MRIRSLAVGAIAETAWVAAEPRTSVAQPTGAKTP